MISVGSRPARTTQRRKAFFILSTCPDAEIGLGNSQPSRSWAISLSRKTTSVSSLPGLCGTTNLSATPGRPACPSRASGWSSPTTPWGFPCCLRFPCVHAAATTPVQRLGLLFAHAPRPISLPRKGRRVGLHIVLFEACSAFTRVAACTLALSPIRDTLYRRLQPFRHLHDCSSCFRLERWPGGTCTHWKSTALPRRTPKADVFHIPHVSIRVAALSSLLSRAPRARGGPNPRPRGRSAD